jgi:hypothetical protein|tara:strand:+ start:1568 stop:1816 length:249 start_codon:yes stop_codon:yes gene_type:complete
MDLRKNNGGHPNAGRKTKAEEVKLIERLTPLEPQAYEALKKGIESGEFKFIQMFYHYYAGKPRETKDITLNSEQPIFNITDI